MRVTYSLGLTDEDDDNVELAGALRRLGASKDPEPGGPWHVPAAVKAAVKTELNRRSVEFMHHYEFHAEPGDDVGSLSAHLGIDVLTEQQIRPDRPLLAKDPDDFDVIASSQLVEHLTAVTKDIAWTPYEQADGLWRLSSMSDLPEPVHMPHAFHRSEGADGLWWVSGDGWSVMTQGNLDYLKGHGIAQLTNVLVDGDLLPHVPLTVVSGSVLEILSAQGVEHWVPIYLAPEDFSFDLW